MLAASIALSLLVMVVAYVAISFTYVSVLAGRITVLQRLQRVRTMHADGDEDPLARPFFERMVEPALDRLSSLALSLTPDHIRHRIQRRLIMAGRPYGLTVEQTLASQILGALVLGVAPAFFLMVFGQPMTTVLVGAVGGALFGFFLPDLLLSQEIDRRQNEVRRRLPDFLDLMVVSVEAGLGFYIAIDRVTRRVGGVLADEFQRALREINAGKVQRVALRDLAERVGVDDLTSFVTAIIQADQMGVSIGNVLRVQAQAIREKRRQRAEEMAQKAPVKMLFPLIFFIFPALFVVILGPAVISLAEVLGNV